jgi:hypothetical protein
MLDRRFEVRLLCADVVEVHWKTNGRNHHCTAGLEDISPSGACLQLERPVPPLTKVRIRHEGGELTGTVKYCTLRDIGYFLGVEFEPGCRWSEGSFRPRHLLDPRRLKI